MDLGGFTGSAGGAGFTGASDASNMGGMAGGMGGILGAGGGGGMGGFDIMGLFKGLFGNPENAKTIGDTVAKLGNAVAAMQKIPPETKQFLQRSMQQQVQQQEQARLNPYGGDMMQFITPEMARGVLDEFGIPYGRMRL